MQIQPVLISPQVVPSTVFWERMVTLVPYFREREQVPTYSRLAPLYSVSEQPSVEQHIHAVRRARPTAWD